MIPIMRARSGEHICVGCGWSKVLDPKKGQSLYSALEEERLNAKFGENINAKE